MQIQLCTNNYLNMFIHSRNYIGDDCAIKDCQYNCSFNGWCSLEFPVGRCVCDPTFYGEFCQYMQCLNNCSWPNGQCNQTSGACNCNPIMDPYVGWRVFKYWGGEDCSFIHMYAGGFINQYSTLLTFLFMCITIVCILSM